MIQQVSIFLENRPGALAELTETLSAKKINMRAFSLADTYDFGIARIIVDSPEETAKILRENNYVVNITDVLAIQVEDKAGALNEILRVLSKNGQNLEYMYAFTGHKTDSAYMIMRTTDVEASEKALASSSFKMITLKNLADI